METLIDINENINRTESNLYYVWALIKRKFCYKYSLTIKHQRLSLRCLKQNVQLKKKIEILEKQLERSNQQIIQNFNIYNDNNTCGSQKLVGLIAFAVVVGGLSVDAPLLVQSRNKWIFDVVSILRKKYPF